MSMFPGPGAVVYRNEAGEPLGWDYPSEPDPYDSYDDDGYDYEPDEDEDDVHPHVSTAGESPDPCWYQ